jgi:hypothetical protein
MSDSDQPGTPPEQPRPKVYLGLPDGYWSWPKAKQREWAQGAAKSLQERLLGSTVSEAELSLPEKPEKQGTDGAACRTPVW